MDEELLVNGLSKRKVKLSLSQVPAFMNQNCNIILRLSKEEPSPARKKEFTTRDVYGFIT